LVWMGLSFVGHRCRLNTFAIPWLEKCLFGTSDLAAEADAGVRSEAGVSVMSQRITKRGPPKRALNVAPTTPPKRRAINLSYRLGLA
jgi:hypothetical protein